MDLDYLKSLIRSGIDETRKRAEQLSPVQTFKRFAKDALNRERTISESELSSALSVAGTEAVSVAIRRGALQVHASFEASQPLHFSVSVSGIHFAQQGAKELAFDVSPPEVSSHPMLRPLLGAFATSIAHGLWQIALGPLPRSFSPPPVDRDAPGRFRVDLRNVETVRDAMRAPLGMTVEVFRLGDLELEDGEAILTITTPL